MGRTKVPEHATSVEVTEATTGWEDLYRLGGIAAITLVVIMLASVAAYLVWPYAPGMTPTDEILRIVHENRAAGLTALDLGVTLSNLVSIPLVLALYVALRWTNRSYALLALVLGLVGIVAVIAARPMFEIFTLSDLAAAAGSDAERARYMAAAEALLVLYHGTAFKIATVAGALSFIISSMLGLRSGLLRRGTAYLGIAANGITMGFALPVVGTFFAFLGMPFTAVWLVMVGRRLLRLARQRAV